jgi:hypothetical protein
MLRTQMRASRSIAVCIILSLCACATDSSPGSSDGQEVDSTVVADADAGSAQDAGPPGDAGPLVPSDTLAGETEAGGLEDVVGDADPQSVCLNLFPEGELEIGTVWVGAASQKTLALINCGEEPIVVHELFMEQPPGQAGFLLEYPDPLPSPESPLEIFPTKTAHVTVRFSADEVSLDELGEFISSHATLWILGEGISEEVQVSATPEDAECLYAGISYPGFTNYAVGDTVELTGNASPGPPEALSWSWTVEGPEGSQSALTPNSDVPNPSLYLDQEGIYTVTLMVTHADGRESCEPSVEEILVGSEMIHSLEINLTWSAAGDPDPTDQGPEAGPDLDLHFRHPFAVDWFDQPFDCFWFNPNPNWGALDPTVNDDPILMLDSTDGSGPEQLIFDAPEEEAVYRVGVHAWSDHGYGPMEAQITISVGGWLAYEATVTLDNHDLWEVATFDGSTGQLEILVDEDGEPLIVSDYESPFFPAP